MGCHIYLYNKYRHEKVIPWIRLPAHYYDKRYTKDQFRELIEDLLAKRFPCPLLEKLPGKPKTVGIAIKLGYMKRLHKLNNSERHSCCSYPCFDREYDKEELFSIYNKMLDTDHIRTG